MHYITAIFHSRTSLSILGLQRPTIDQVTSNSIEISFNRVFLPHPVRMIYSSTGGIHFVNNNGLGHRREHPSNGKIFAKIMLLQEGS